MSGPDKPCVSMVFEEERGQVSITISQTKGAESADIQRWVDNTAVILQKHLDMFIPNSGIANIIIKVQRVGKAYKFDYNTTGISATSDGDEDKFLFDLTSRYAKHIMADQENFIY